MIWKAKLRKYLAQALAHNRCSTFPKFQQVPRMMQGSNGAILRQYETEEILLD